MLVWPLNPHSPLSPPFPMQLNFPASDYASILPALQAHTHQAVLEALRKDSALWTARTSRHKGVRQVAPGQWEARSSPAVPPHASPGPETLLKARKQE